MASNTCETLIWERSGKQSPITEKGVHLHIKKEKPAKETGKRMMSEVAQDLGITVGTLTTSINRLIKKNPVFD